MDNFDEIRAAVRKGNAAAKASSVVGGMLLLLSSCSPGETQTPGGVVLRQVASGFERPVFLTVRPDDPATLYVVEANGSVRTIEDGRPAGTRFLDLRNRVRSGGERGLLSIAFHPDYASNGWIYAYYTDSQGDVRISRFHSSGPAGPVDASTEQVLLLIAQPFGNHNGGQLHFGPDGMLYVGVGDGGSGGDPQGHGQNRRTLLGTLLRLDGNGAAPADNPFVNDPGAEGEIWAYGLRNPWRFSFDRATGDLYIADVGQNRVEEIDWQAAGSAGGSNYGWNIKEGTTCFAGDCEVAGLTEPVAEYGHDQGCSITGGYVYRGSELPDLVGHYLYSDYCDSWLRSIRVVGGLVVEEVEWIADGGISEVSSFGEDGVGNLYLLSLGGTVHQVVPR